MSQIRVSFANEPDFALHCWNLAVGEQLLPCYMSLLQVVEQISLGARYYTMNVHGWERTAVGVEMPPILGPCSSGVKWALPVMVLLCQSSECG